MWHITLEIFFVENFEDMKTVIVYWVSENNGKSQLQELLYQSCVKFIIFKVGWGSFQCFYEFSNELGLNFSQIYFSNPGSNEDNYSFKRTVNIISFFPKNFMSFRSLVTSSIIQIATAWSKKKLDPPIFN